MRTQPLPAVKEPPVEKLTRSARLVRTIVFGLAIVVGIATVIVLATRDQSFELVNPSRIFSPSGHLPGEPNGNPQVSMTWTGVSGAVGYWWGMVSDPAHLPRPAIRPSGNDRSVFFRFKGTGYFALRTATRVDGRLRWSDAFVYGPIIVREGVIRGPQSSGAPGSSARPGSGADDKAGSGGEGGSGGSTARATPRPTVDPRYAGQPGSCGSSGSCGTAGEPGEPPQMPGGGSHGRPSSDAGTPGRPGPNGGPGPTSPADAA